MSRLGRAFPVQPVAIHGPNLPVAGTDVIAFSTTGTSAVLFTLAGMVDAVALPVSSRSTASFALSGTDLISLPVASKSTATFALSGTDALTFAVSSISTAVFALAGMTDRLAFPVSSLSSVVFSLSGSTGSAAPPAYTDTQLRFFHLHG